MEVPVNRVEAAGLVTVDVEKLLPLPPLKNIDIAQFLEEGLLLREKPFRAALKVHDWTLYEGSAVALHLSTEAIVPPWAFLLIGMYLAPHAAYYTVCSPPELADRYRFYLLEKINWESFRDKKILLKGCASVSPAVLTEFFRRVLPLAQLVFYGEACSSVPIYKRKNL